MRILGVDPSLSNTGLALLRYYDNKLDLLGATHLKTLPSSKKVKGETVKNSIQKRLYNFNINLKEIFNNYLPDIVVIEEPVVFRNSKGVINVSYLIGSIITMVTDKVGFDNVILVNPSTVKKVITGKGNADKDLIKQSVLNTYNFDLSGLDNDEIDGIAIAITGFKQKI